MILPMLGLELTAIAVILARERLASVARRLGRIRSNSRSIPFGPAVGSVSIPPLRHPWTAPRLHHQFDPASHSDRRDPALLNSVKSSRKTTTQAQSGNITIRPKSQDGD